uniref:Uncharacterized protein n=1 Tax=Cacopsylla melanoneura TaxID=428564 RepID=A0A8D8T1D1_9HEMI
MFAKICFCLVNLWLWSSTAEGLPVNHALADYLHTSDTNSLLHQNSNSNVRFESKRYIPRYKTFASYPVFDVRTRSTSRISRGRPSTTPISLISYDSPDNTHPANVLPQNTHSVELLPQHVGDNTHPFSVLPRGESPHRVAPTVTTPIHNNHDFHSNTPLPTPTIAQIGEILSMRVSTSVTNSHSSGEDAALHTKYTNEKPLVRESTTELYHQATVTNSLKPDGDLNNPVLDSQTSRTPLAESSSVSSGPLGIIAYYNLDSNSGAVSTTSATLVNPDDLTKSRTMDYYAYNQQVDHQVQTDKPSSTVQIKPDEQPEESKAVTTRILPEYLPTPEASYGKPEENYEVSEEDSVRSNGRIHGVQTTSITRSSTEGNWETTRIRAEYLPTPEENYEVSEEDSVRSNGRIHGIQTTSTTTTTQRNLDSSSDRTRETPDEAKAEADRRKSNYVVEGRNYKKYRVEEETSDGFIVGEYGVFSHDDGSMRGVRYTAESNINPRLIYHALLKFLSLQ